MAVNYASKYSNKVDERFTLASITEGAFNQDYDWEGVSTVNVYSLATAAMQAYTTSGMSRYGTPDELSDTVQTLALSQDRSFTFTIDRRNYEDTMMVREAGSALRRQIDEVVIPEIDTYRLAKLVAGAGTTKTAAITSSNAYDSFLDGVTTVLDNKAPLASTIAYVSTAFYKNIRLDASFIKASDVAQNMLVTGQVGMVEGVPLVFAPTGLLPANTGFVITNRAAAVAPQKLAEYKTHDNPPGVNGWLCEGRIYHDAFVINSKKMAIYAHMTAAAAE